MECCERTTKRYICLTPLSDKVCKCSSVLGVGYGDVSTLVCFLCLARLNEENQTGSNLFKIVKKPVLVS